jgi:uncharacterized glyoxalase superfamily protein PhnB
MGEGYTLMPDTKQLLTLNPALFVPDMAHAIHYYQETLGFQKDWDYGDPTFYASVSRDGLAFHLRHADTPPHLSGRSADTLDFYFMVADVDLLYNELFGRGAKIVYGPAKQEYGMKEFYVEDCHGYRIGFGQVI